MTAVGVATSFHFFPVDALPPPWKAEIALRDSHVPFLPLAVIFILRLAI